MSDELYGQPAVANRDLIDQRQMLCISDLASASGEGERRKFAIRDFDAARHEAAATNKKNAAT
jgi:hypothetical protein